MKITDDPFWLRRFARNQMWLNIALMVAFILAALVVDGMAMPVVFLLTAGVHCWAAATWEEINPSTAEWYGYLERQHAALIAREAASHHVIRDMKIKAQWGWLATPLPLVCAVFAFALSRSVRAMGLARPPGVPAGAAGASLPLGSLARFTIGNG